MFAFIVVFPICFAVYLSFFDWNGIKDMSFAGWTNFKNLFLDKTFVKSIVNNLKFMVISSGYQFFIGLLLAIVLSSIIHFRDLLKVLFFIPCIVATVAISQIFMKLLSLNPMGVLNKVFEFIGITPKSWLGSTDYSLLCNALIDAL
jgi:raffinose/stachyose/melibiose transport system permease protein